MKGVLVRSILLSKVLEIPTNVIVNSFYDLNDLQSNSLNPNSIVYNILSQLGRIDIFKTKKRKHLDIDPNNPDDPNFKDVNDMTDEEFWDNIGDNIRFDDKDLEEDKDSKDKKRTRNKR